MKSGDNSVVQFHYSLSDGEGNPIESSKGSEPLTTLLGAGGMIPGVEAALIGRAAGDNFKVTVTPDQAYGERQADLMQRIPAKYFPPGQKLQPGMVVQLQTQQGPRTVTVVKVGQTVVDCDLNHPMAGMTLNFEIDIVEVREASAEEISHGHVHGPGGHHH